MNSAAILWSLVLAVTPQAPTADNICIAWKTRETEYSNANVTWSVVRDSRTANFGFADLPTSRPWRVTISGIRWRVDGERWTIQGKDDRLRAADTDPARARLEFRQILLEQRLAGRQFLPQREAVSVTMTKSLAATTRDLIGLERVLSEAAIYAIRPLLLIHPERLTTIGYTKQCSGDRYAIFEERIPGDSLREFWIDIAHECRIVRIIEKRNGLTICQSDLTYDATADQAPLSWTVMRFDEDGNVVEFAVATNAVLAKTPPTGDVFGAHGSLADVLAKPFATNWNMRRLFRTAIDSNWLLLATLSCVLIFGYARWRTVWNIRPHARATVVRSSLAAIVAFGGIILVRSTPIFDPPLSESQTRVLEIWNDVQNIRRFEPSGDQWDAFANAALPALDDISRELEKCVGREGVWPRLLGRDRPTQLARRDLFDVAKHDLPAIIGAGVAGNNVREHAVVTCLDRVDDHLAGFSPYVMMPRAKAVTPVDTVSADNLIVWCNAAVGFLLISVVCLLVLKRHRSFIAPSDCRFSK